jgi:hypothetical protein
VAVLSERGLPALAALLLLFGSLFLGAWRLAAGAGGAGSAEHLALAASLAAAAVVGCFDAFLLLPAPALLFWPLAGALAAPEPPLKTLRLPEKAARRLTAAALLFWGAAIIKSSAQVAAMAVYTGARTKARVTAARWLDPSNMRIAARHRGAQAAQAAAARSAPAIEAAPAAVEQLPQEQPPAPVADTD